MKVVLISCLKLFSEEKEEWESRRRISEEKRGRKKQTENEKGKGGEKMKKKFVEMKWKRKIIFANRSDCCLIIISGIQDSNHDKDLLDMKRILFQRDLWKRIIFSSPSFLVSLSPFEKISPWLGIRSLDKQFPL